MHKQKHTVNNQSSSNMPAPTSSKHSLNNEESLKIENPSDTSTANNEKENVRRRSSISLETIGTPPKKISKKSEPKIVENMKEYFDNDTLDKLTTATLRHWLKQQQVHCTTREKKASLMEKVQKHFLKKCNMFLSVLSMLEINNS